MIKDEFLSLIQHMDDEWQEDWDGARIRAELRRLHEVSQELLGVVEDILSFAENDWSVPPECINKARAAIAKATGEQ